VRDVTGPEMPTPAPTVIVSYAYEAAEDFPKRPSHCNARRSLWNFRIN
jgi:hypothetical protein